MGEGRYDSRMYRRPILLSLVALLEILAGVIAIMMGAYILAIGIPEGLLEELGPAMDFGAMMIGAIFIVIGLIVAIVGAALFSGKMWGWWFSVIMTIMTILSALVAGEMYGVIIPLIILLYLMTGNTRGWFKSRTDDRRRR